MKSNFLIFLLTALSICEGFAFQTCGHVRALQSQVLVGFSPQRTYLPRVINSPRLQAREARRQRLKSSISASLAFADFDNIRESLRAVISILSASGGALIVAFLLSKAVSKREATALSIESVASWLYKRSPAEIQKLSLCIALDILGFAPDVFVGPLAKSLEVLWAPLYAFLLYSLFGSRPLLYRITLATAGFLEEIVPYTEYVPSATIGWILEVPATITCSNLHRRVRPRRAWRDRRRTRRDRRSVAPAERAAAAGDGQRRAAAAADAAALTRAGRGSLPWRGGPGAA